jgi:hypothetical protein
VNEVPVAALAASVDEAGSFKVAYELSDLRRHHVTLCGSEASRPAATAAAHDRTARRPLQGDMDSPPTNPILVTGPVPLDHCRPVENNDKSSIDKLSMSAAVGWGLRVERSCRHRRRGGSRLRSANLWF